jgi:hypothetical protein
MIERALEAAPAEPPAQKDAPHDKALQLPRAESTAVREDRKAAEPAPRARRPMTVGDVRAWVAATPAPGEPAAEPPRGAIDVFVEDESTPRHARARPVRSSTGNGVRDSAGLAVQHVDLSIGTVQVTVEAAPAMLPPAPSPPPAAAQARAAPTWPRLARRYVRI